MRKMTSFGLIRPSFFRASSSMTRGSDLIRWMLRTQTLIFFGQGLVLVQHALFFLFHGSQPVQTLIAVKQNQADYQAHNRQEEYGFAFSQDEFHSLLHHFGLSIHPRRQSDPVQAGAPDLVHEADDPAVRDKFVGHEHHHG